MRRQVLLQELHLVGENAAVGEDQVLGLVRNVGRIEQLQAGLLRQSVRLFPLQCRQAVTTFIQLSRPPRDSGVMWSRVSRK